MDGGPTQDVSASEAKVALIGSPHHTLGVALCRHLSAQGMRLVITDPDPDRGAAVCRRLAWQGVNASYRFFSAQSSGCEQSLYEDLSLVFGRLDLLVSFFDSTLTAPAWLSFTDDQARQLLLPNIEFRRRMLKSLDPLFTRGAMHLQVCMGSEGATGAASALLWERLLASYYHSTDVISRTLTVDGDIEAIDRAALHPRSIDRDLDRLIKALQ